MDTYDLQPVRVGGLRIGGFLGHFLYSAGNFLRRVTISRRTWLFIMSFMVSAIVSSYGVRFGLAWHDQNVKAAAALALQSPVQKGQFIIEDTHSMGMYLVARRGTWHLKLHCEGSQWKDKDGAGQHSYGCSDFKVGDTITLEKWDTQEGYFTHEVTYVNKFTDLEGENTYKSYEGAQ